MLSTKFFIGNILVIFISEVRSYWQFFFAPRKIANIGTIAVFIVAPLKLQIAVANLANTLFLY